MTIATRGKNQWLVPSTTRPGLVYIVVRNQRGQLSCDCDGAFFTGHCKHQTAVAEKLANEAQVIAVDPAKVAMARSLGMMK